MVVPGDPLVAPAEQRFLRKVANKATPIVLMRVPSQTCAGAQDADCHYRRQDSKRSTSSTVRARLRRLGRNAARANSPVAEVSAAVGARHLVASLRALDGHPASRTLLRGLLRHELRAISSRVLALPVAQPCPGSRATCRLKEALCLPQLQRVTGPTLGKPCLSCPGPRLHDATVQPAALTLMTSGLRHVRPGWYAALQRLQNVKWHLRAAVAACSASDLIKICTQ
jgi:hypothetical protein